MARKKGVVDGDEAFTWPAIAGSSDTRPRLGLLGQSGMLEHFDVTFLAGFPGVEIRPGPAFPGTRHVRRGRH
ncbi:hypothetical protein OJF2_76890 [Aquisphaera giovannonii]|uniref:Uncharacterized protein n=1 Tax=Aquisphaera giovannonii TaxID=406548 RepID=A0A5B9WEV5_9BACT|nr:hypothetical protein [Aquisphaera giovannonii]QEH39077.1 hypothetical protein OJF2_76890 [Aquisphaera giovannonii]